METRTKVGVAAGFAIFMLGVGLGIEVQPQPKAPSPPPPEVVVKYIDRVEEVQVEVPGKLPEPCLKAIDTMAALDAEQLTIGEASGDMILEMSNLSKAAVTDDLEGMTLSQEAMRKSSGQLNSASINTMGLIDSINLELERCESAID